MIKRLLKAINPITLPGRVWRWYRGKLAPGELETLSKFLTLVSVVALIAGLRLLDFMPFLALVAFISVLVLACYEWNRTRFWNVLHS